MESTLRTTITSLFFALLITTAFAQPAISLPAKEQPGAITLSPQPEPDQEPDATTLQFEHQEFDFGTIKQGDVVKHTFVFTNTGEFDAIIENVKPSCGCTSLKAPTEPIPPGEKGEIEIEFNSAGKSGHQDKSVTIIYNGNPRFEQVYFMGDIEVPEGTPEPAPQDHH